MLLSNETKQQISRIQESTKKQEERLQISNTQKREKHKSSARTIATGRQERQKAENEEGIYPNSNVINFYIGRTHMGDAREEETLSLSSTARSTVIFFS